MVTVPKEHPGGVTIVPTMLATLEGKPGQVVINVQMAKAVNVEIYPNVDPALRKLDMKSYVNDLIIDGRQLSFAIESTSKITDFSIDYERNQISFMVRGFAGVNGTAIVPIGQVLNGQYGVLLHETPLSTVKAVDESGTSKLMLEYPHSVHKITISGASVVPELSTGSHVLVLSTFAVFIGTILMLRNKIWTTR